MFRYEPLISCLCSARPRGTLPLQFIGSYHLSVIHLWTRAIKLLGAVTFLISTRDMYGSNLGRDTDYTDDFRDIPRTLQECD